MLVVAVLVVSLGALILRVMHSPTDISWLMSRFYPITIELSQLSGDPAGRLSAERFVIHWEGRTESLPAGLGVEATHLKIVGKTGNALVEAAHARMRLLPRYLLGGYLRPVRLEASDGIVHLRLFKDGDLDLDWPDARRHLHPIPPFSLRILHQLKVSSVELSIVDAKSGHLLTLRHAEGVLNRPYTRHYNLRWDGRVEGQILLDHAPLGRSTTIAQRMPEGSDWISDLPLERLSALQSLSPVMGAWPVPVAFHANVSIRSEGPALTILPGSRVHLAAIQARATMRGGQILQKDAPAILMDGGGAEMSLRPAGPTGQNDTVLQPDGAQLELSTVWLKLRDSGGTSHALRGDGRLLLDHFNDPLKLAATLNAQMPGPIDIPKLASIWPKRLLPPVRSWVVSSLTQGYAQGLDVHAKLSSQKGLKYLDIAGLQGQWHVRNATLHWRRPIPPGEGLDADLLIKEKNTLDIAFSRGVQTSRQHIMPAGGKNEGTTGKSLTLRGGHMRIDGLFAPIQQADLNLHLTGDLSGFINILSEPVLKLMKGKPLPFSNPSGAVDATGNLRFPLEGADSPEAFKVKANADFKNVALDHLALGQSVSGAQGHLTATQSNMTVDAKGKFAQVPTKVHVDLSYAPKPASATAESFEARSVVTPRDIKALWSAAPDWFTGQASLVSHYIATEDGHATLQATLDLQNAAISTPLWQKADGLPASASAIVRLHQRAVSELPSFEMAGPGIAVKGWGQVSHGSLSNIDLREVVLGESAGKGRVIFPADPAHAVAAELTLKTLDIAPLIAKTGNREATLASGLPSYVKKPPETGRRWVMSLTSDEVLFHNRQLYHGLQASSEGQGPQIRAATLYVKSPSPISATLAAENGHARVRIAVHDLGAGLENIASFDRIEGGHLTFDGVTEGICCTKSTKISGNLDMGSFAFRKPPQILQTLAHAALVDWSKTSKERFRLDRLHARLVADARLIQIEDGYFGNQALGATLKGRVDLHRHRLDLHGTVVPAFGLNAILGRFPDIGRLFSPEKEGGVFAATYTLTGPFNDPQVSTNPFSVFLPGVIRSLND